MSMPTLKTYTCLHSILIPSNDTGSSQPIYNPSLVTLLPNTTHRSYRSPCPHCQTQAFQTSLVNLLPVVPLATRIADASQHLRHFFLEVITRYLNAANAHFDIPGVVRARIATDLANDADVKLLVQQFEVERRKWNIDSFFSTWVSGFAVLRDCTSTLQRHHIQPMTDQQTRDLVWRISQLRGDVPGILTTVQGLEDGVAKMQDREGMEAMRVRMGKAKEMKEMGPRKRRGVKLEMDRMELRREAIESAGYAAWQGRIEGLVNMR